MMGLLMFITAARHDFYKDMKTNWVRNDESSHIADEEDFITTVDIRFYGKSIIKEYNN